MLAESLAYYRAALSVLKHVEAQKPTNRRFGAEADALWAGFAGDLTTSDRIDTLLRDADAQWPGAFGARTVFDLRGVAEDESFGAEWESLEGVAAEDLWRALPSAAGGIKAVLDALAAAWDLRLSDVGLDAVKPADHIVVVGPSAIAALIQHFEGKPELDWSAQVTVIASVPGHRQLAAAAPALLGLTKPTALIASDDAAIEGARARLKGKSPKLVVSNDAQASDLAAAQSLVGAH